MHEVPQHPYTSEVGKSYVDEIDTPQERSEVADVVHRRSENLYHSKRVGERCWSFHRLMLAYRNDEFGLRAGAPRAAVETCCGMGQDDRRGSQTTRKRDAPRPGTTGAPAAASQNSYNLRPLCEAPSHIEGGREIVYPAGKQNNLRRGYAYVEYVY